MTDSTRVNDIQDKLLTAMDILNEKRLQSISYDRTILCTIEDDTNKKEGKYEVSDGSVIFTAYSQITNYSKGTQVYVTIPNGNYDNQKMIIGKKTSDIEQPFVFTTPFDSIFDLTGNLAVGAQPVGLTANGSIASVHVLDVETDVSKLTRLGIAADFRTIVREAASGHFGLRVRLTATTAQVEGQESEVSTYTYELDSSDMYGNPYNFETYYRQEAVINIEHIETINHISIELYQMGDFKDKNGQPLSSLLEGTEDELPHNIFIDNIEVCCGLNLEDYTSDAVQIYTADSLTYNKSQSDNEGIGDNLARTIKTRWVHIKNGTPLDMSKDTADTQYEIRWYRYVIGAAAADNYCGTYWTLIGTTTDYKYQLGILKAEEELALLEIDSQALEYDWNEQYIAQRKQEIIDHYASLKEEYNKFIAQLGDESIYQFSNNGEINRGQMLFYPNVNWQQEKIKVIIFVDGKPYRSNELVFENEDLVPSKTTLLYENALEIIADDETNGNYMVYGQDNKLLDTMETSGKALKTLGLVFDSTGKGEEWGDLIDTDYVNVYWYLPKDYSMLKFQNVDFAKAELVSIEGEQLYKFHNIKPQYKIANYFNHSYSNNTIIAQYTVNNIEYTTSKKFTFGPAGTMGTEQTIVIDFASGDQTAINKNTEDGETTTFKVSLYDSSNKEMQIPDGTPITWTLWNGLDNGYSSVLSTKQEVTLRHKEDLNIDNLFGEKDKITTVPILRVTVGNLETYFSIPFKLEHDYSHISGATQVIYQTNGEPSYSREDYTLYKDLGESIEAVSGVTWELVNVANINPNNKDLITPVVSLSNNNSGYLKPIGMYLSNTKFYAIRAIANNQIVWVQPILVMQNKWSSNVINKWDGETIQINEEEGTIIAPAIAAGKKHDDNTFSGVMIGDWGKTDTNDAITKHTGVYGFNKGQMSYSFTDDGNATIGKSGQGQIKFNGNEGIIQSGSFENTNKGMQIDLDEPYIFMRQDKSISLGSDFGVNIVTNNNGIVTKYEKTNGSYNHPAIQINNKFKVGWDGTLYANNGWFEGHITGTSGKIGGWEINGNILQSAVSNSKRISLDSSSAQIKLGSSILLDGWNEKITIGDYITLDGNNSQIIVKGGENQTRGFKIATNNNKEMGIMGFIWGNDGETSTYNIGITSKSNYGIVFEAATNGRFSAAKGLFFESDEVHFSADANKQYGIYARFA